ncbi:hypothetical protein BOTBODRAFT_350707 [Botryobasidium botryosum FD-172 SS1]|uniref:Uncharacterized protein n=1 Tax=Botryobasidium botryosum (strain FD-172 SS1) TaxID=930990 RepID=A0A067MI83_BOTB1|nr:hypothetical protein BOTBODRAFT_350707 [Botryobasidium botryosum FD-172 SS1]
MYLCPLNYYVRDVSNSACRGDAVYPVTPGFSLIRPFAELFTCTSQSHSSRGQVHLQSAPMFATPSSLTNAQNVEILMGLVAEVLLYGIYMPLFSVCTWIMISRKEAPKWKLIAPLIVMFILSTTHIAVALYSFIESFMPPSNPKDHSYHDHQIFSTVVAAYGLYNMLNFIGDGIVIYRCYVICNSFKVVVLPIVLHLASTVMGIYSTASFERNSSPATTTGKFGLIGYCLSLVLNVACTGLIAHRIWTSTRMISPLVGSQRAAKCYEVLGIIIESAALYIVAMVVLIGTYVAHTPGASQLAFQIVVQIVCIVPTLMLVRAGLSQKLRDDWDATRSRIAATQVREQWPMDRQSRSMLVENSDERGTRVERDARTNRMFWCA